MRKVMIVFGATLLLSGCNIQNPFQTEKKPENQVGIPDVNKEEQKTESNQNETIKRMSWPLKPHILTKSKR